MVISFPLLLEVKDNNKASAILITTEISSITYPHPQLQGPEIIRSLYENWLFLTNAFLNFSLKSDFWVISEYVIFH